MKSVEKDSSETKIDLTPSVDRHKNQIMLPTPFDLSHRTLEHLLEQGCQEEDLIEKSLGTVFGPGQRVEQTGCFKCIIVLTGFLLAWKRSLRLAIALSKVDLPTLARPDCYTKRLISIIFMPG